MAKQCFKSSPGFKVFLRISFALIVLAAVSFSGCGVETPINEDGIFKFIHHPETYLQADGMPMFDELIGEIVTEPPRVMGDLRRGFQWDWSGPLSFEVQLPRNPELSFEWGFSKDAHRLGKEFTLTASISQSGSEQVVAEISGMVGKGKLASPWSREKIDLVQFNPGKAVVTFSFEGLTGKIAEDNFILANPCIYSKNRTETRDVIIIAVDTLRADHMGSYGYDRPTSDNIDEWAKSATRYDYCISVSPWTFPSFAAMLTGRYPSICGGTSSIRYLPSDETCLPEIMSNEGFSTFSIVSTAWVGHPVNLHQGLDGSILLPIGGCDRVFSLAREWMDSHMDEDKFLFLHFMDPHTPYNPPRGFNDIYDPGYKGKYAARFGGDDVDAVRKGDLQLTDEEKEHLVDLYDGEITFFDREFGKFASYMEEIGIDDNDLVIFTADHGEEFFEHGGFEHGHTLYDEILHVPLIIKGNGFAPGEVDKRTVSTIDIFPTVLEFFDIPVRDDLNGFSLLGGIPDKKRFLLSEQMLYGVEQKGVTTSQYRYIYNTMSGFEELYDLAEDSAMMESVADERRASCRPLESFVVNYITGLGSNWHVLFFPRKEAVIYSGQLSCDSGFAGASGILLDEEDSYALSGNRLEFSIRTDAGNRKEINFVTNDEAADVEFEIRMEDSTANGGIYVGMDREEVFESPFTLNINDERFSMGDPWLPCVSDTGVYIWGIPTRLRDTLQPNLTPEMEDALRSIGYLQ